MQLSESALAAESEADRELAADPLPACNENGLAPVHGVSIALSDATTIFRAYRINYYD